MPAHRPLHEDLLSSDDDQSWRRHIAWQSAALAPHDSADLELNKAVEEVGLPSSQHLAAALPPHLWWVFPSYSLLCTLAAVALLALIQVNSSCYTAQRSVWLCLVGAIVAELVLSAFQRRRKAAGCVCDRWVALDIATLTQSLITWTVPAQIPATHHAVSAVFLALRFALQLWRISPAAPDLREFSEGAPSVRSLRPKFPGGTGTTLDSDMSFDTGSCCSSSELRAEHALEAKQDQGFESGSCCSTSELRAERALEDKLEAKQACELGFDDAAFARECLESDMEGEWESGDREASPRRSDDVL